MTVDLTAERILISVVRVFFCGVEGGKLRAADLVMVSIIV